MEFVAIDVETANADMASICQIGLAKYKDGDLVEEWSSLINPEDYFDNINTSIHGIDESDVSAAPLLRDIAPQLEMFVTGSICVSHTHFDRVSIYRAFEKNGLQHLDVTWLDSARVARRTWEECAERGYGLANVCKIIGYEFKHHDALEDAKAAGQVMLSAIHKSGLDIDEWLSHTSKPVGGAIKRDGNPDGELYGEVLVFTGALQIPRAEAAALAASAGCTIGAGVTKKTTLLVVGDQDITKLAGKNKSTKHIKAENMILKGQQIRILRESDFKELVAPSS